VIKLKSFLDTNITILGDGILGQELSKLTGGRILSRKKGNFQIQSFQKYLYPSDKVIINCIANTDTYSDNELAMKQTNFLFPIALSEYCKYKGAKLIHISTEYVYAGNNSFAKETDLPVPHDSYYAKYKLLADHYISLLNPDALICRLLHKPYPFPYDKVWDVLTSGDTVNNIAPIVVALIKKEAKGIVNVGTGAGNLSKIAPGAAIVQPPDNAPKDTTMDLTKLLNILK